MQEQCLALDRAHFVPCNRLVSTFRQPSFGPIFSSCFRTAFRDMISRSWTTYLVKAVLAQRPESPWPEAREGADRLGPAGHEAAILRLPTPIATETASLLAVFESEAF